MKSPRTIGDPISYAKEQIGQTKSAQNFYQSSTSQTAKDEINNRVMVESNLCYEVSKTILSTLTLYLVHYKVHIV
jgi:hypothetical protein